MEILPNLYFTDFIRRRCNSNKNPEENEINGQAARPRQTVEVATQNSVKGNIVKLRHEIVVATQTLGD